MLLRLKIRNFRSFAHETEFNMFPNPKRASFANHVYHQLDVPLLKQAAIYGANGSGKSNFVKAMLFLKKFTTNENFLQEVDLEDSIFQLTDKKRSTIEFEIEFLTKQTYYIYKLEIGSQKLSEALLVSGLNINPDRVLFQRDGSHIDSEFMTNESSAKQLLEMNNRSSVLPLNQKFPVFSSEEVKQAFTWFSEQLEIITINSTIPSLINIMSQHSGLIQFANELFENIGIGIHSVKIAETPFEEWIADHKNANEIQQFLEKKPLKPDTGFSRVENNRNIFSVSLKQGIQTVQEFLFEQLGANGFKKELKITAQSDGTVRLLTLIPAIYNASMKQNAVIIDEIDNSIHPNLMFSLIKFFGSSHTKGQLIFTTHSTNLINQQELLRPDEIWLTEKENGSTRMYSINDFRIHNTINLENGYLDGRYGAVPQIKEPL